MKCINETFSNQSRSRCAGSGKGGDFRTERDFPDRREFPDTVPTFAPFA